MNRVDVLLAAVVLLAAGCDPSPDRSPAPSTSEPGPLVSTAPGSAAPTASRAESDAALLGYHPMACHFPTPDGGRPAGYMKSCGRLVVPENRSRPDSRIIQLQVVVVSSDDPKPAPDPVLIVSHGAGGDTIMPNLDRPVVAALRQHRDVILVDGRGTGMSTPSLDCTELEPATIAGLTLDRAANAKEQVAAWTACADRLTRIGTDLEGYTSVEVAADMADLRTGLGYDAWNLFGTSYGTREELEVVRTQPAGIRSVILDSVVPTDVDSLAEWGPNAALALDTLFDGCAADPACGTAHPDLRGTFDRLVARLDAKPMTIAFEDPWARTTRSGRADGDTLILGVFQALYSVDRIRRLPAQIDALDDGDTELLEETLALQAQSFGSEAAYFRIFCGDSLSWTDPPTIHAAAQPIKPSRIGEPFEFWSIVDLDGCAAFGAGRGDPDDREPVVSDIPTLILSGEYDPITPPAWGARAATTLERATQVVFPGIGHGVLGTVSCAERIANAFLDDPTAAVDAACAAALPGPKFRDGP